MCIHWNDINKVRIITINNVYDLMNLTVNNLQEVEGIGEKTSNNVYEFLHKGVKVNE